LSKQLKRTNKVFLQLILSSFPCADCRRQICPTCRRSFSQKLIKLHPTTNEKPKGVQTKLNQRVLALEGDNLNNPKEGEQNGTLAKYGGEPCENLSCQEMRMFQNLLK